MDDVLGDGIRDQDLLDNDCYKEIQSHMDLRSVSRSDYETVTAEEAIKALIRNTASLPDPVKRRLLDYQVHFTVDQEKILDPTNDVIMSMRIIITVRI